MIEAQQRTIDERPEMALRNLDIDAGSTWARKIIEDMISSELPSLTEN